MIIALLVIAASCYGIYRIVRGSRQPEPVRYAWPPPPDRAAEAAAQAEHADALDLPQSARLFRDLEHHWREHP